MAANRVDAARTRIVQASQKIIALIPDSPSSLSVADSHQIAQLLLEVLGGVGDIALYGDPRETRRVELLRTQLAVSVMLFSGHVSSNALAELTYLPLKLAYACSLGVKPSGSSNDTAIGADLSLASLQEPTGGDKP